MSKKPRNTENRFVFEREQLILIRFGSLQQVIGRKNWFSKTCENMENVLSGDDIFHNFFIT